MSNHTTGIFTVGFTNISPGNTIIKESSTTSTDNNISYQFILFTENYLSNMDCSNIANAINNVLSEYRNILALASSYALILLNDVNIIDYGYKAQIDRLSQLINYILIVISNMNISKLCNENIVSIFIGWLYENSLEISSIFNLINGLNSLTKNSICSNKIAFNILIGKLINTITLANYSINNLNKILEYSLNSNSMSQSYIPIYMPSLHVGNK